VIDADNAEKVIEKYDALRKANEEINAKQQQIEAVEKRIEEYLIAVNGMSIRYAHQDKGVNKPMIFELETNNYGEQKIKMGIEN
jgi:septation ring formation regulator EzrA